MVTNRKRYCSVVLCILLMVTSATASPEAPVDWRENMKNLQYSPRYFGPNAFPIPELRNGSPCAQWEVELRGEYHLYGGDHTKDLFARVFAPIANGLAGLEVSVLYEYYNMTKETVEERHAAGPSWKNGAFGDVVVSSFVRFLKSDKWADVMAELSMKTASGERLVDARFTDAVTYWFNINAGRCVYKRPDDKINIRLHGLAGFYCWMTNDMVHRQNDAFLYSVGLNGEICDFTITADVASFYGYENNGDRPLQLRTKINYEIEKNILSFGYKHGMRDSLYNVISLAYIRRF